MTISTTPNLALPWPNNDEPVTNGWDAIRDLAVALDTELNAEYGSAWPSASIVNFLPAFGGAFVNQDSSELSGGVTFNATNDRLTVSRAGIYLIVGRASLIKNGTGVGATLRGVNVQKNATTWHGSDATNLCRAFVAPQAETTNPTHMVTSCVRLLAAGDWLNLGVQHNAGTAVDLQGNRMDTSLDVFRLSAT